MEIFGIAILVILIGANAASFFNPISHNKRIYNKTVQDTSFNKNRPTEQNA